MVRQKQGNDALNLFTIATRLDPGNARYSYAYAIALADAGQTGAAIKTLQGNLTQHPYDRDSLAALVTFCERAGKSLEALNYAQRLYELDLEDPQVRQMLKTLSGQSHH
jgi:predicted Zn-dependent protease